MANYGDGTRLSIVRLNSGNYHQWKFGAEMLLLKDNLWEVVSRPFPESPTETWKKCDNAARASIALSMEASLHYLVMECKTSREMWIRIKEHFERVSYSAKIFLKRKLYETKLQGNDMNGYITKVTDIVNKLRLGGTPFEDEEVISTLLCGLPESYDSLIMTLEAREESTITLENVKMKLSDEAQRREEKLDQGGQQALVSSAPRVQKFYSQRPERICFECKKPGHIRINCPEWRKINDTRNPGYTNRELNFLGMDNGIRTDSGNQVGGRISESSNCAVSNKEQEESSEHFFACVSTIDSVSIGNKGSEWVLDSGATTHMSPDFGLFTDFTEFDKYKEVTFANGTINRALGKGSINLTRMENGTEKNYQFNEAIYVPDMKINLLSVPTLCIQHYRVVFNGNCCQITRDDEEILSGNLKDGVFIVSHQQPPEKLYGACVHEWHRRLAHRSIESIKKMQRLNEVENLDISNCEHTDFCDTCQLGGMKRMPFQSVKHRQSTRPFQLIHSDLCGPVRPTSRGGGNYFITLIDDYSRYCYVEVMSNKSQATKVIIKYITHFKNKFGYLPERFRSDGGGEYENHSLNSFLENLGIKHELCTPYQAQQNGVSERINQTLIKMIKCLLIEKNMPKNLWGEMAAVSCYIYNRVIHSYTNNIPYTLWEGRKPDFKYLKTIGSKCFTYVQKQFRSKLDPNSNEAIIIGYGDRQKGYRLLDLKTDSIVISRNVRFDEKAETNLNQIENVPDIEIETTKIENESEECGEMQLPRRSQRTNIGQRPGRYRD